MESRIDDDGFRHTHSSWTDQASTDLTADASGPRREVGRELVWDAPELIRFPGLDAAGLSR
jgi:hypothetical protein